MTIFGFHVSKSNQILESEALRAIIIRVVNFAMTVVIDVEDAAKFSWQRRDSDETLIASNRCAVIVGKSQTSPLIAHLLAGVARFPPRDRETPGGNYQSSRLPSATRLRLLVGDVCDFSIQIRRRESTVARKRPSTAIPFACR